ncbi:MAG: hypothetical protein KDA51_15485 [Planctomycetales bacterium]|nr:hypothetical protein [Planctomycetales bacterium]
MARKVTVKVEADVPLHAGREYRVVVCHIEKKTKPQRLEVDLRNLHANHEGRMHRAVLPLPLRSYGCTAGFFRAVGEELITGREFAIRDAIGKVLAVTFGESSNAGQEIISFARIKETQNAPQSQ